MSQKGHYGVVTLPRNNHERNFLVLSVGINPWWGGGSHWRGRWDGRAPGATRGTRGVRRHPLSPGTRGVRKHPLSPGVRRHPLPPGDTEGEKAPTDPRDTRGEKLRNAPASHIIPRGGRRCLFRPQGSRDRGLAGGGQTPAGIPKSATVGSLGHPRALAGLVGRSRSLRRRIWSGPGSAEMNGPRGRAGHRQMLPRCFSVGPLLLQSPLGQAGPEGARGGRSCSPLISQLNN